MNRRQQINKLIHSHIEIDSKYDYTNYKKLISAIDNYSKELTISFCLFCVENYYYQGNGWWNKHYTDEALNTEELLNQFLKM